MANWKKLASGAAGAAGGGAGLNIEDIYSTYIYSGNSSTQHINNGIDFTGEDGMAWFKCLNVAMNHNVFDTIRGNNELLKPNTNSEESAQATGRFPTFTSTGFTLGNDTGGEINYSGRDYISYSFRKAPKFFDIVTYTGNATNGREIAHNLGSVPGMIIVKRLDSTGHWPVYHRGIPTKYVQLNLSNGWSDGQYRFGDYTNPIAPTSTHFTISSYSDVNASGGSFVAYIFAHNDGDGDFGPTGDQDIIKCGTYDGNGSSSAGPTIDLGFEPQWLLIKRADSNASWQLMDNIRGIVSDYNDLVLSPDSTDTSQAAQRVRLLANGFKVETTNANVNSSNNPYIYVAIRRGLMGVPEDATNVFEIDTWNSAGDSKSPNFRSGFPVDMALRVDNITASDSRKIGSRLTGYRQMFTNGTNSEGTDGDLKWDFMNGVWDSPYYTASTSRLAWMWRRAPNFFDVVTYQGSYPGSQDISHNLGVAPEMMWVKARSAVAGWKVYHKDLNYQGAGDTSSLLFLEQNYDQDSSTNIWGTTSPTDTVFTVGNSQTNNSYSYIAYLFASLAGVSKVGSYTGNGTSQNIDCGFSNGARFVLVKKTSSTGAWMFFDTERGIVTGNDGTLALDNQFANNEGADYIDPYSAGFTINWAWSAADTYNPNANGASYIFYAVA